MLSRMIYMCICYGQISKFGQFPNWPHISHLGPELRPRSDILQLTSVYASLARHSRPKYEVLIVRWAVDSLFPGVYLCVIPKIWTTVFTIGKRVLKLCTKTNCFQWTVTDKVKCVIVVQLARAYNRNLPKHSLFLMHYASKYRM